MKNNIILIFIVFILSSFSVLGFGATQPGTVVVPIGESKIVDFSVQNGGGATDDVIATLSVVTGGDIVEIIEDNKYLIPAGGEITAKVKINVPRNANPDDTWDVKLAFRAEPVEPSTLTGMVGLGYGVDIRFNVLASEPAKELPPVPTTQATREVSYNGVYAVVVIVAIAVIIYFFTRKKKTTQVQRKKK